MACRVCPGCDLRVPDTVAPLCPACGTETKYEHMLSVDEDWEYKAAKYIAPQARKLILWRRRQFVEAGFVGPVLDMLVESKVEPRNAASLISHGCSVELAARILL